MQNSETTLSTSGFKTIKLTTDNKTTSLENFPKSSQTGVNSMTPVVGDDPRAEALTNLSGLMSIVSSNPYKRFTQKANKKNTSPSEEFSFKSVRPTLHSFEEWNQSCSFLNIAAFEVLMTEMRMFISWYLYIFEYFYFDSEIEYKSENNICKHMLHIYAHTCLPVYWYFHSWLKKTVQVFLTKNVVVYYEVDDSIHKWVIFVLILSVHVFYLEHLLLIDSKSGVNNIIIN